MSDQQLTDLDAVGPHGEPLRVARPAGRARPPARSRSTSSQRDRGVRDAELGDQRGDEPGQDGERVGHRLDVPADLGEHRVRVVAAGRTAAGRRRAAPAARPAAGRGDQGSGHQRQRERAAAGEQPLTEADRDRVHGDGQGGQHQPHHAPVDEQVEVVEPVLQDGQRQPERQRDHRRQPAAGHGDEVQHETDHEEQRARQQAGQLAALQRRGRPPSGRHPDTRRQGAERNPSASPARATRTRTWADGGQRLRRAWSAASAGPEWPPPPG